MPKTQIIPRVIHSSTIWLPRTQTWLYNQVKQLEEIGAESHVICERTDNLEQFAVSHIHSLDRGPFFSLVLDKGLRRLGIRRYLSHFVRKARELDTEVVHSHFGNVGWANLGAVRKLKAKHIVTFYGLDVNKLPVQNPIWHKRYQQLFIEVDRVLCEGHYMAGCVVELGCPEHKVKVQHLGVDVDCISFQPRKWQPGKVLKVLIAASFREKKGIPYAIEALGIIARKVPVQLTIIGDAGRDKASQQEKAKILAILEYTGLKKHTRLLGYQNHKIMLQAAYEHHLFLQPSVTARDGDTEGGAPVAIIEMMAAGMPVVATTHCDIPEVVGKAYEQCLAPERDALKLAKCIYKLLDKHEQWPMLSTEGRKHIEHQYHLRRQAYSLAEHYSDILKSK